MKFSSTKICFSLLTISAIIVLFLPAAALAAGVSSVTGGLDKTAGQAGLQTAQTDLPTMIGTAINYLFGIIGVIFLTIALIGGYLWMTAGGNEEKIGKAKGFIINGINGMIVIFLAYALVYTILFALKSATGG